MLKVATHFKVLEEIVRKLLEQRGPTGGAA